MTIYVHIQQLADGLPNYWAHKAVLFHTPGTLPADQQVLWDRMSDKPLAEWLAPFARAQEHSVIYLSFTADVLDVVSNYADGIMMGDTILQKIFNPAGYMRRTYSFSGKNSLDYAWLSDVYSSVHAQAGQFVAKNLQAFNEIDIHENIPHVDMSTHGPGAYTWMSYGATIPPGDKNILNSSLNIRWAELAEAARENNLPIDESLRTFALAPPNTIPAADFREMFNVHGLARQTLKAFWIGNTGFLRDPDYRFHDSPGLDGQFARPFVSSLRFSTQDPDFQTFLAARLKLKLAI